MLDILVVDKDKNATKMLADLLMEEGYHVSVTGSAAQALYLVVKERAQVVLLGDEVDDSTIADLIPVLKQCNKKLSIIFMSGNAPLSLIRQVRNHGIFYHALKPLGREGWEEIRQAVRCAFATQLKGFCPAF
ncbi:response regulator [Geomonas sp. RF6]|uniref:response regulator n=1 Tax=Geomonas sp. RF6 TaxID=2897342 RepID=UPI001E3B9D94|nr:response regulator [Geomonas sp. RF6]UFS70936.1 response regulator [Geomonas sp. RF6]